MPRKPSIPGPFESLFREEGPARKRKGRSARLLRRLFLGTVILTALAAFGTALYYNFLALRFDMDQVEEVPQRTLVYDRDGEILGHVSGHGENRLVVDASEVSPHFINALLAREDSRFYSHWGVDLRGVARAAIGNLRAGSMDQGASTLTMQLARNTFGLRDKTLHRKLLEVAIARRIERAYNKDEILGFYMNRIYFGSGLYGIERAAQGFFMKPASELSLGEGAMLAGVIRGPSLLNPFRNLEDAKGIRGEVLDRMIAEELINEADASSARNEEVILRPPDKRIATGSYTLQTVFDLLSDFLAEEDIKRGGLKIHTTIDSQLQASAEASLDQHLSEIESRSGFRHPPRSAHRKGDATRYLQGAVVSLDNTDGGILAMVGGRSFGDSSFNRAYQARRQAGSTFKPFVYTVAYDRSGFLPGVYVDDGPIRITHNGGPVWSPGNSDGTFGGLEPAALGLIRSRNTMSIRVGQIAGLEKVRRVAYQLKFGEIPDSPVIFLGAFETTPMTLTSAYSSFAAKGVNYAPYLIKRIEHADGDLLFQNEPRPKRVFRESTAWVTSDVLGKVMDKGTGTSARRGGFKAPAYGKTGTTDNYKDAWFVGYTDKVTTGVWVGLDQPKTIMDRGYGSTLALPVWTEVMKTAENTNLKAAPLADPPDTQETVLCRECGKVGSNRTLYPYSIRLPANLRPNGTCRGHGFGLFAQNRNRAPRAFPLPGATIRAEPIEPLGPREGSIANAFKKIGRWFKGGRDG